MAPLSNRLAEIEHQGPPGRSVGSVAQVSRQSHNPLADRAVSSGSVYSTILIATVVGRCAPTERVDVLGDVGCGDSPYRSAIAHGAGVLLHEQPFDFRRLTSVGLATSLESAGSQVDSLCPVGGAAVGAVDGVVRGGCHSERRVLLLMRKFALRCSSSVCRPSGPGRVRPVAESTTSRSAAPE